MEGVLSRFGKGTSTSVALNFAPSGTANCDPTCRLHPESTAENPLPRCYAVKLETFRKNARQKLERHGELHPAQICNAALYELQMRRAIGEEINWLRFSSSGSLPIPSQADRGFIKALRALLTYCVQTGILVHFPVETAAKAKFYRRELRGLNVVVRESLQDRSAETKVTGAVAFLAGDEITNGAKRKQRRKAVARLAAKRRSQATGRKTIVCPATFSDNLKARCGTCTACAQAHIDVVYPLH